MKLSSMTIFLVSILSRWISKEASSARCVARNRQSDAVDQNWRYRCTIDLKIFSQFLRGSIRSISDTAFFWNITAFIKRKRCCSQGCNEKKHLRHPALPAAAGGIHPLPGENLVAQDPHQQWALPPATRGDAGRAPGRGARGALHQRDHRADHGASGI